MMAKKSALEHVKEILEREGYTWKPGIGSEFEIFAFDKESDSSVSIVATPDSKITIVSNLDVETQEYPEYFEVDDTESGIIVALVYAFEKDKMLREEV